MAESGSKDVYQPENQNAFQKRLLDHCKNTLRLVIHTK